MVKFGPSGNSRGFYEEGNLHSEQAFEWLSKKGLDAYEYSFGRGINLSDAKAEIFRNESKKHSIEISVHAPYYINFANPDPEMIKKSIMYLINSCKKLAVLGGKRVVFHAATVGKLTRQEAFDLCLKNIDLLISAIYENKLNDFYFCAETMGKINQIGDVDEVAQIVNRDACFLPAIDFGHLNARTLGGIKSKDDYKSIVEKLFSTVGEYKTKNMHVHFSKIEYSKGGEVRHLTLADTQFGPPFEPLAYVIDEYKLSPIIISESEGTQAEDALTMKKIYMGVAEKNENSGTYF
jgi:deoxyribonuclease-4